MMIFTDKYHHKSGATKRKERATREASLLNGQRKLDSIFVFVGATGSTSQNIAQAGSVVCSSEFPEVNVEDEERELD